MRMRRRVAPAARTRPRGEQPGGVYRLDIADARLCTVRGDTKAKCEAVRAFMAILCLVISDWGTHNSATSVNWGVLNLSKFV